MGKMRLELFRNALDRHGARKIDENETNLKSVNHLIIVFDENTLKTFENVEKAIGKKKLYSEAKNRPECQIHFVKSLWLSDCLKQKRTIPFDSYQFHQEVAKNQVANVEPEPKSKSNDLLSCVVTKRRIENNDEDEESSRPAKKKQVTDPNSSSYSESEDETGTKINGFENDYLVRQLKATSHALQHSKEWTCARSSKEQASANPNAHVIKKLEEMSTIYESTRDKFRAMSYQKAIIAIKRLTRPIQTREVSSTRL